MAFITARKRGLGQGNIFSSMCQESCLQGSGSASVHAWIPTPPPHPRPRSRHTLEQKSPGSRHPPPRGADNLPQSRHPQPPWCRHPPVADPPLRSACWKIRSTSGRYASYGNAILLCIVRGVHEWNIIEKKCPCRLLDSRISGHC